MCWSLFSIVVVVVVVREKGGSDGMAWEGGREGGEEMANYLRECPAR